MAQAASKVANDSKWRHVIYISVHYAGNKGAVGSRCEQLLDGLSTSTGNCPKIQ